MNELEFPLVPVRDVVIFPHAVVPISLKRERSVRALEAALLRDKKIFLVMQRQSHVDNPKPEELYNVGTVATVSSVHRIADGAINIIAHGEKRGKIKKFLAQDPHFQVEISTFKEEVEFLTSSPHHSFRMKQVKYYH